MDDISEDNSLQVEVEDIMCDQGIISAEVDIKTSSDKLTAVSRTRIRVAVSLFVESIVPAIIAVYYAYLRNQNTVVESVRRQILPSVFAFLANSVSRSLSSVQRGIAYPLGLRGTRHQNVITYEVEEEREDETGRPLEIICKEEDIECEKSVDCIVLHQPPNEQDVAVDVIFIHGLHGSLVNTWKQGVWKAERKNIKNAIVERSRSSVYLPDSNPKAHLKRSVSSDCSERPVKYSKTEDLLGHCMTASQFEMEEIQQKEDEKQEQNESYSKCWPKDWISKDFPNARVIALNYTTDPYLWRPVWIKKRNRSGLQERSQEMIRHLLEINVGNYPIVWVGHSKGGLYVKQIMIQASESNDQRILNLYQRSSGIMFYSVPHRGSSLANFTLPFLSRSVELLEVQKDCQFVLNLHNKFLSLLEDGLISVDNIFSFIETSLTFMSFMYIRIVALDSADPGIGKTWGIPLDHREICKPSSKNCFLYRELLNLIKIIGTNNKDTK